MLSLLVDVVLVELEFNESLAFVALVVALFIVSLLVLEVVVVVVVSV